MHARKPGITICKLYYPRTNNHMHMEDVEDKVEEGTAEADEVVGVPEESETTPEVAEDDGEEVV